MKLSAILAFTVLFAIVSADCGNELGPWIEKTACPADHREGAAQAMPDGKLYIFNGFFTNDLYATNRLDIYDPQADRWTRGTGMPHFENVTHCQSAAWIRSSMVPTPAGVGRTVIVAGGFVNKHPGPIYNEVWRYDTVDDAWTRMPDLPEPRASAGVAIDSRDRLHFISGLENRFNESAKHWTFNLRDPNAKWEDALDAPETKNHYPAVPHGDWIYTPGGVKGHDAEPLVDQTTFNRFNNLENRWEKLADLPEPRSHAEASTMFINERLVQFGGRNKNPGYPGVLGTVAEYNLQTNTWQFLRSLPYVSTTPTVGFFKNITVDNVLGDYLVLTVGGIDWNIGRRNTFVSKVTFNCTTPDPAEVFEPEDLSESTSESQGNSEAPESSSQVTPTSSLRDDATGIQTLNPSNASNGSSALTYSFAFLAVSMIFYFGF